MNKKKRWRASGLMDVDVTTVTNNAFILAWIMYTLNRQPVSSRPSFVPSLAVHAAVQPSVSFRPPSHLRTQIRTNWSCWTHVCMWVCVCLSVCLFVWMLYITVCVHAYVEVGFCWCVCLREQSNNRFCRHPQSSSQLSLLTVKLFLPCRNTACHMDTCWYVVLHWKTFKEIICVGLWPHTQLCTVRFLNICKYTPGVEAGLIADISTPVLSFKRI